MLKTLVKLRLVELFAGYKNKNTSKGGRGLGTAGLIIILFFAGISILFLFGMISFGLALSLSLAGYSWLFFGIMAILAFMLCFIGTVFMTKQQMFEAKDNHTLLPMPIKPMDILISRILSIAVMDYLMALLVAFPAGLVYAVVVRFTVVGALFYILGMLLLPLLALAFSVFFGWVLAVISNRMKHKNAVTMVFSTVFLLIYFYLCFSWQSKVESLIARSGEVAAVVSKFLPSVYHFGLSAAEGNAGSFLIHAAICVIPFALSIYIVSRNFVKIITSERGSNKIEYKGGAMKTGSEFKALCAMELKRFTSSTTYMLNAGMGLMFMVLAAGALIVKKKDMIEVLSLFASAKQYVAPVLIIALLYMSSMTIISSGTISLEAKTLWQIKVLPVNPKKALLAKAYPHIVISIPVVVVACVIAEFFAEMSAIGRVMLILIPVVSTFFNGMLGVIINVYLPKFNWSNEAQAIKQGASPLLAMLFAAIPPIIFTVLTVITGAFGFISMDVLLIIIFVLYTIGTILLYFWLAGKCVDRFKKLQNG